MARVLPRDPTVRQTTPTVSPKSAVVELPVTRVRKGERLRFVSIALLLGGLFSAELPHRTPGSVPVQALCVLLIGLMLWRQLASNSRQRAVVLGAGCALCLIPVPVWAASLGVLILFSRAERAADSELSIVIQRVTALLLCFTVFAQAQQSLWLYQPINEMYARLRWSLGGLVGGEAREGFSMAPQGPMMVALFVALIGVTSYKAPIWQRACVLLAMVGGLALSIALNTGLVAWACAALVLLVAPLPTEPSPSDQVGAIRRRGIVSCVAVCLASIIALFGVLGGTRPALSPVVGVVQGGLKTLTLPPSYLTVVREDADFSGLQLLLPEYGLRYQELPARFTRASLQGIGVLFVINPTVQFSADEIAAVDEFVNHGGALLVLGDHTDIGGLRGPVNQLIHGTDISLNYDSAIPVDSEMEWFDSIQTPSQSFLTSANNGDIGICVGASLTVGSHAQPIVGADQGFSDRGNPKFGLSHLGNMQYDQGERIGGLVLAAEQRVGDGVVQVWGDTTGFQNSCLSLTHESIGRIFKHLREERPYRMPYPQVAVGVLLLCFGLILWTPPTARWALVAAIVCGVSAMTSARSADARSRPTQIRASAVFDTSAIPDVPRPGPDGTINRFTDAFSMRREVLTAQDDFEHALQLRPSHFVIMGPTMPYSQKQANELVAYVRDGGHLLLFAGHDSRDALLPILRSFDLDISSDPFGTAHNSRIISETWRKYVLGNAKRTYAKPSDGAVATAYDADLSFLESYPVIASGAETLVECWGRPIAVRKQLGKGSVSLVGDSRFATGKNLGRSQPNVPDLRFIVKLMD